MRLRHVLFVLAVSICAELHALIFERPALRDINLVVSKLEFEEFLAKGKTCRLDINKDVDFAVKHDLHSIYAINLDFKKVNRSKEPYARWLKAWKNIVNDCLKNQTTLSDSKFRYQIFSIKSGALIIHSEYPELDKYFKEDWNFFFSQYLMDNAPLGGFPQFPILTSADAIGYAIDSGVFSSLFAHHLEYMFVFSSFLSGGDKYDPREMLDSIMLSTGDPECDTGGDLHKIPGLKDFTDNFYKAVISYSSAERGVLDSIKACRDSLFKLHSHLTHCLDKGLIDRKQLLEQPLEFQRNMDTWYALIFEAAVRFPNIFEDFDRSKFFRIVSFVDTSILKSFPEINLRRYSPFSEDDRLFLALTSDGVAQRDIGARAVLGLAFYSVKEVRGRVRGSAFSQSIVQPARWLHHLKPTNDELNCHIFKHGEVIPEEFQKSYWILKENKDLIDFYDGIFRELANFEQIIIHDVKIQDTTWKYDIVIDTLVDFEKLGFLGKVVFIAMVNRSKPANGIRFVIRKIGYRLFSPITAYPIFVTPKGETYSPALSQEEYKKMITAFAFGH